MFGRSISACLASEPVEALRAYLTEKRSKSAKRLAGKAVVLIEPAEQAGLVVWPDGHAAPA